MINQITEKTAYNSGLAKVAVHFSAETFVVKIATFAKPQTVRGNPNEHPANIQHSDKRTKITNTSQKLKELQADTQINAFAAHLILPNPPNAHPPPNT